MIAAALICNSELGVYQGRFSTFTLLPFELSSVCLRLSSFLSLTMRLFMLNFHLAAAPMSSIMEITTTRNRAVEKRLLTFLSKGRLTLT